MQNLFSFQTPSKALKFIYGSGDISTGTRDGFPLSYQRKTKRGGA